MATTKKAVSTKPVLEKKEKVVKKAAVKATAPKNSTLKVDVLDVKGKVIESIHLPEVLFGARINKPLMAQAVRVYLANQRSGTASTKSRGEVAGSTRKIYRQKGTGRARHGGVRAPIFVKGGIAHGPKPHDFSLSMPQKMRQQALFSALSSKLKDNEVKLLSGFESMEPKTKHFAMFLKSVALDNKKSILLVIPDGKSKIAKSVRNIEGLTYIHAVQLNTYDVLKNQAILIMKDAVETLENHFKKEKKNV